MDVFVSDNELASALETCAAEPIQRPGTIQPHGHLFILDAAFQIERISANLLEFLSLTIDDFIGQPIERFLPADTLAFVRENAAETPLNPTRSTRCDLKNSPFVVIAHRYQGLTYIELEPCPDSNAGGGIGEMYQRLMRFSVQAQRLGDDTELFQLLTDEIHKATGFARVDLYRFDDKWNGTVVSETKQAHMTGFLGLSFPESDIPKQARQLYSKNYLRLIPDVGLEQQMILPPDQPGAELDLSFSVFRSVSKVHIQYLKNMGVGASMSISILQNGKLWGLVACHHHEPHFVPYSMRMQAELIGHSFSALLSNMDAGKNEALNHRREQKLIQLRHMVKPTVGILEFIGREYKTILDVVDADGLIANLDGRLFSFGLVPDLNLSQELVKWLELNYEGEVFVSHAIARDTGLQQPHQDLACGVLAVPVSANMTDYIIWFRREQLINVAWAGAPDKTLVTTQAGRYLSPRASFERWQKRIRGQSKPWTPDDVITAQNLSHILLSKKYEDNLSQNAHNINAILQHSQSPSMIVDIQGSILMGNTAAGLAFAEGVEPMLGKTLEACIVPAFAEVMREKSKQILATQEPVSYEQALGEGENERHYIILQFPLFSFSGAIYAVCMLATDITKQVLASNLRLKISRELEHMAYVASHDLREPLRVISSFTTLLQEEVSGSLSDDGHTYINFIIDAAGRMRDLIDDLLAYASVENAQKITDELIDIPSQLGIVLQELGVEQMTDVEVSVQTIATQAAMRGADFRSVVMNLIGNGIKYGAKTGKKIVRVSFKPTDTGIRFTVSDNGIGIAPVDQARIFEPFKRLHNRDAYPGTGIGLALCVRIMQQYGGTIEVHSEAGQGSEFVVNLPSAIQPALESNSV